MPDRVGIAAAQLLTQAVRRVEKAARRGECREVPRYMQLAGEIRGAIVAHIVHQQAAQRPVSKRSVIALRRSSERLYRVRKRLAKTCFPNEEEF